MAHYDCYNDRFDEGKTARLIEAAWVDPQGIKSDLLKLSQHKEDNVVASGGSCGEGNNTDSFMDLVDDGWGHHLVAVGFNCGLISSYSGPDSCNEKGPTTGSAFQTP